MLATLIYGGQIPILFGFFVEPAPCLLSPCLLSPCLLSPPRWWVRRPPPVAALRCRRVDAPTIGAANEIEAVGDRDHRNLGEPVTDVNASCFCAPVIGEPTSLENRHEGCAG